MGSFVGVVATSLFVKERGGLYLLKWKEGKGACFVSGLVGLEGAAVLQGRSQQALFTPYPWSLMFCKQTPP